MVLLGGLEIVVGGYLIHRHQKNKNEKKRLEDEARQRRHDTFPGAKRQNRPPQQQHQQPVMSQQQKYACYAPQPQHPQTFPQNRPYPPHSQSRPQPTPQFHHQVQPLGRADAATMPVANRPQPQDIYPPLPPRRQASNVHLQPPPHQQPYYNTGYSVSVPAFEPLSNSPYTHTANAASGRQTVDDNWETYAPHSPHVHFNVPASPQLGEREDDAPPPYRP